MNIVEKFEDEIEPFLNNICVNKNQLNAYVGCLSDVYLNHIIDIIENTKLTEIPNLIAELKLERIKRS